MHVNMLQILIFYSSNQVGLVTFSTSASTPIATVNRDECFGSELALATPQNKETLIQYIRGIQPYQSTVYSSAINKAFQMFQSTDTNFPLNDTDRRKILSA